MILWRISRHRDLSGQGGLKASGRWHHAGQPAVYLAGSPSAALLEVCVHTAANDLPPDFTLLMIEGPDMPVSLIELEQLPQDWRTRLEATRDLGNAWLRKKTSVLLQVPSAIVPATANFLFNPRHANAEHFHVTEIFTYPFDPRLKT